MKQIKNKKNQQGFSLIEVAVSMLMIGVMLVLYAAALNIVSLSRKLRYENFAYHIANKQMEDLRNTDFTGLPASGTITDPMLSQLPTGAGSFTVTDYPGYDNLKEIVVTVGWDDGNNKQVVLRTFAGLGGVNP